MTKLFGHSVRSELLLLYVAEALACFLAFALVLHWGLGAPAAGLDGAALGQAALLAACAGVASGAAGLYQPAAWQRLSHLLAGTLLAGLAVLLLAGLAFPALPPATTGWPGVLGLGLGFAAAVGLTRLGLAVAARVGLLRRRLVLLRASPEAAPEAPVLAPGLGGARDPFFEVALALPADAPPEALSPGRLRALGAWAVVAEAPAALPEPARAALRASGLRVFDADEFAERRLGRVDPERLRPGWLAGARAVREGRAEAALRRLLDVATSLLLLAATLPLLAVAALAIKLDGRGPVFYRQERVGRGGRVFSLYKFRSMVVDAEVGGAPRWATRGDPRVTRVGRILRLTRVDEIPQVLNVLRGEMSFVGPRPERPAFVAQLSALIPQYDARAVVKPGITGWAQVNYPYGASVEDARMKLAYDLYYVQRRSLFLDLLILVSTVRVVLFQEGSR